MTEPPAVEIADGDGEPTTFKVDAVTDIARNGGRKTERTAVLRAAGRRGMYN